MSTFTYDPVSGRIQHHYEQELIAEAWFYDNNVLRSITYSPFYGRTIDRSGPTSIGNTTFGIMKHAHSYGIFQQTPWL